MRFSRIAPNDIDVDWFDEGKLELCILRGSRFRKRDLDFSTMVETFRDLI